MTGPTYGLALWDSRGIMSRGTQSQPFAKLIRKVLEHLAEGQNVSLTGLSNSGKSDFLRKLSLEERAYKEVAGRPGILLYIDCNRAVAASAQAFYEVVLRSGLECFADHPHGLHLEGLREYHQLVTQASNAFAASLSFNLALSELCEQLDQDLCLLIDEFDEIYVGLDDRALLNLRALRDRYRNRLRYVTATERSLPDLRGRHVEGEFAEMFSRATYALPLLDEQEAVSLLANQGYEGLDGDHRSACLSLAGGHPGLLVAIAESLASLPTEWEGDPIQYVKGQPQPLAECLKLWSQLREDEQDALSVLVLEAEGKLTRQRMKALRRLGLIRGEQIFSPLFAGFVSRKARGADIQEKGIYLDQDSGEVWVDGMRIPVLTDLEYRLLKLLYERMDMLTDKYKIVEGVWGEDYLGEVDDARVEKLVSRLRSKIEPDPGSPMYLITRRGRGYKLFSEPQITEG